MWRRVGKSGVERIYEEQLRGKHGKRFFLRNARGQKKVEIGKEDFIEGSDLNISINFNAQKKAYDLLDGRKGSIVVIDLRDFSIPVAVSAPSISANDLRDISSKEYQALLNDTKRPLFNRAFMGLYPPGSTIKPIVALSALENNVISPNFKVNCSGKIEMYGQTYNCWKKKGHGVVNLRDALKVSCDTFFYEMSRRLGVDRLNETAKKFGLGNKVFNNIFNEEKAGLVPSTEWKKNALGRGWVLGETLITGIGQGYIQTTPLQLCLMTAQLANGGFKINPKMIVNKDDLSFERIINVPKRSIGDTTIKIISEYSKDNYCSLEIASKKLIEQNKIKPKTKIGLSSLLNLLEKWRYDSKKKLNHNKLLQIVLDESGYRK